MSGLPVSKLPELLQAAAGLPIADKVARVSTLTRKAFLKTRMYVAKHKISKEHLRAAELRLHGASDWLDSVHESREAWSAWWLGVLQEAYSLRIHLLSGPMRLASQHIIPAPAVREAKVQVVAWRPAAYTLAARRRNGPR